MLAVEKNKTKQNNNSDKQIMGQNVIGFFPTLLEGCPPLQESVSVPALKLGKQNTPVMA